jgi:hypothetical protein
MALPSGQDLRALERESRKVGSHVHRDILLGEWKLVEIWGRTNREPSSLSGEILRALRATLQISASGHQDLLLINSIELLGIKISFQGPGRLVQKRPLLCFHFQRLQLQVAGSTLFSIPLPQPSTSREEPFFALISSKQTETGLTWIAARGRGGGLALWVDKDAIVA